MLINDITSQNVVAATAKDEHFPEGVGGYTFCRVEVQKRLEHAGFRIDILRGVDQRGDGEGMMNNIDWRDRSCGFRVIYRV